MKHQVTQKVEYFSHSPDQSHCLSFEMNYIKTVHSAVDIIPKVVDIV